VILRWSLLFVLLLKLCVCVIYLHHVNFFFFFLSSLSSRVFARIEELHKGLLMIRREHSLSPCPSSSAPAVILDASRGFALFGDFQHRSLSNS
jgi:hypothetical protein